MNIFTKIAQIRQDEVGPDVNEEMLIGGTVGGAGTAGASLANQARKLYRQVPDVEDKQQHAKRFLRDMLDTIKEQKPTKMNYRRAAQLGLLGLAGGTLTGAVASTFGSDKDKYVESTNTNNPSTQKEA